MSNIKDKIKGNNLIEKIKNSTNCVQIANHLGLAIEHSGDRCKSFRPGAKNPLSLIVNDEFWTDFGDDQKGGDCIALWQNIKQIEIGETLKEMAEYLGIKQPSFSPKQQNKYQEILEFGVNKFHEKMPTEKRQYYKDRGLTDKTIDKYKLGYGVNAKFKTEGFDEDTIKESGMLGTFQRYVIPYIEYGKIKYLISREDDAYPSEMKYKKLKKQEGTENPIFGLESITKADKIYIVEGMFDALTMLQEGHATISPITGSFSSQQTEHLLNTIQDKEVTICFDYDPISETGQKGTWKLANLLMLNKIKTNVILLPGKDEKVDISDLYCNKKREFNKIFDLETDILELKATLITTKKEAREFIELISQVSDKIEQLELIDILKMNEDLDITTKWIALVQKQAEEDNETFIIDRMCKTYDLRYMPLIGFYQYNELSRVWEEEYDEIIEQFITAEMGTSVTGSKLKSVLHLAKVKQTEKGMVFNDNPDLFSVKNGMLDMRTRKIRPRTKEDYVTISTDYEYSRDADTTQIEVFLQQVANQDPERVNLLKQIMGYCITKEVKYHKAFILYGKGRNGKSVFLDMLIEMVGKNNKSSLTLEGMGESFQLINLKNKMINVAAEISDKTSGGADIFKKVIAGDYISACKKNKDFVEFKPFVKLLFSTNRVMSPAETTDGYMDRIIMIDFPCKYVDDPVKRNEHPKIEDYFEKYIKPNMAGVLNIAMDGLEMLEKDKKFIETKTSLAHKEDMKVTSNSIYAFARDMDLDGTVYTMNSLYSEYKTWTMKTNSGQMSQRRFVAEIKETCDCIRKDTPSYLGKDPHWEISL